MFQNIAVRLFNILSIFFKFFEKIKTKFPSAFALQLPRLGK